MKIAEKSPFFETWAGEIWLQREEIAKKARRRPPQLRERTVLREIARAVWRAEKEGSHREAALASLEAVEARILEKW